MILRRQFQLTAVVVGVVCLALTVVGGLAHRSDFFRSYLMGYTFWLGLGLGLLGVAFVQFLTGGVWGLVARRTCEAGAVTIPLFAVLFVPVFFGLSDLYSWARPDDVAASPVLQHKAGYMNIPFFVIRAVVYLVCWVALSLLLRRWSTAQDETGDWAGLRRLQRLSIVGALLLGVTVSFAAIDWLMSIDSEWYSTMYPPLVAMSDLLLALAFAIVVVVALAHRPPLRDLLGPRVFNDLGSLLLAFLMLWAYMAFFQYLLIRAGNLVDEIPWYLRRIEGGWMPVAVVIAAVGFLVPFWFLLFRPLKRNRRALVAIAVLLVAMRLLDVYWLVEPPFEPGGPLFDWLDAFSLIGFGGLWLAIFGWQLAARPLVPPNDPRLAPALEAARAGS